MVECVTRNLRPRRIVKAHSVLCVALAVALLVVQEMLRQLLTIDVTTNICTRSRRARPSESATDLIFFEAKLVGDVRDLRRATPALDNLIHLWLSKSATIAAR